MNFQEAIRKLKEGKKIKRERWIKPYHITSTSFPNIWCNEHNVSGTLTLQDTDGEDWEVYCKEHDWEEHGCAGPIKQFFICRNCEAEKKLYETQEDFKKKFHLLIEKEQALAVNQFHKRSLITIRQEFERGMEQNLI